MLQEENFTVLLCYLMARIAPTVIVSLILLIGYIYAICMHCKSVAGKTQYTDDQIWKPFEKAEGVFVKMIDRVSLPLEKLRRILPKNDKKDGQ